MSHKSHNRHSRSNSHDRWAMPYVGKNRSKSGGSPHDDCCMDSNSRQQAKSKGEKCKPKLKRCNTETFESVNLELDISDS